MSREEKIEQYQDNLIRQTKYGSAEQDSDTSIDQLLQELDDDEGEYLSKYRDQRLEQISEHLKTVKNNVESGDYGSVKTFTDENQLIKYSASSGNTVIHFFLDSFKKCNIMDAKLEMVAEKHLKTRFLRISVENCPFLVEKLSIKVLPVVIAYCNGVESDRLIGFSKLGNNQDDFSTQQLENWLLSTGVISPRASKLSLVSKSKNNHKLNYKDDDDSSDWD